MTAIKQLLILMLMCGATSVFGQSTYLELSEKAMQCIEADSLQKAEELLKEAMKLEPKNPSNAMLFSNLGLVQKRMGQLEKAAESYTYALNIMPNNVNILLDRAALFLEMGQNTPALYDYNRVLDRDSSNEEALMMRAYIYMSKREYGMARNDFERLLALKPNDYNTTLGLITLDQKEMKYKDALERVNKMLTEHDDDALLYAVRADIERETKHEDLALIDLDRAIELNPQSADAYLLRGDIYLLQNKKTLARSDFEKAMSLGVPQSEMRERLMQVK